MNVFHSIPEHFSEADCVERSTDQFSGENKGRAETFLETRLPPLFFSCYILNAAPYTKQMILGMLITLLSTAIARLFREESLAELPLELNMFGLFLEVCEHNLGSRSARYLIMLVYI